MVNGFATAIAAIDSQPEQMLQGSQGGEAAALHSLLFGSKRILTSPLLLQLAKSRALVDFSQGLDIRLITRDNVALLNQVRTKTVHFAWDNPDEDLTRYFRQFLEWTSIKNPRLRRVYLLTNYGSTHEQDLYRVETLRQMGFDPYVMIYEKPTAPPITRHLQRWVNNKRLFYAIPSFSDYEPVKKLLGGDMETR